MYAIILSLAQQSTSYWLCPNRLEAGISQEWKMVYSCLGLLAMVMKLHAVYFATKHVTAGLKLGNGVGHPIP